ncbi:MAG: molybdopterin-guanine dinucleotide biosynthesis protein MobB [Gammaproteobacteria bacterium]
MTPNADCPIVGFAAFSGTGKTTLLTRLLPVLHARGLRIGMVKHAHHSFDIDHPGKDSYELRKAGAEQMLVASRRRWALMCETPERSGDPELSDLIAHLDTSTLDLILVEGFKHVHFPKIELHRPSLGHPLLAASDDSVIAVAADATLTDTTVLVPLLDLNDPEAIADFIVEHVARH